MRYMIRLSSSVHLPMKNMIAEAKSRIYHSIKIDKCVVLEFDKNFVKEKSLACFECETELVSFVQDVQNDTI